MDDGSPFFTSSIPAAARICELMGPALNLNQAPFHYERGWGCEGLYARPVQCSWKLTIQDLRAQNLSLWIDLFNDKSPPILGLDVKRHARTDLIESPIKRTLCRPSDISPPVLSIYIRHTPSLNMRARLNVILSPSFTLVAAARNVPKPLSFVRRQQRFIHAAPNDLIRLPKRADFSDPLLPPESRKLSAACIPSAKSSPPLSSKKVSLGRVESAFNRCIQDEFAFCLIRGTRFCAFHSVESATSY